MSHVTGEAHQARAKVLRHYYSLYEQNADLFNVGAYTRGANPELDRAVELRAPILRFLNQGQREAVGFDAAVAALDAVLGEAAT
jgi:flagellum-specific ATP synthase